VAALHARVTSLACCPSERYVWRMTLSSWPGEVCPTVEPG